MNFIQNKYDFFAVIFNFYLVNFSSNFFRTFFYLSFVSFTILYRNV